MAWLITDTEPFGPWPLDMCPEDCICEDCDPDMWEDDLYADEEEDWLS